MKASDRQPPDRQPPLVEPEVVGDQVVGGRWLFLKKKLFLSSVYLLFFTLLEKLNIIMVDHQPPVHLWWTGGWWLHAMSLIL